MNHPSIILVAAVAATAWTAQAQQGFSPDAPSSTKEDVKYTLLKPADKTLEQVKPDERNPFAKIEEGNLGLSQKSINEENQIRERLSKLRVCGVSPGANGLRVMLGDLVLEPGQMVPQLLAEQSVGIKVGNITAQAIELLWMEARSTGLPPRKLVLAVDLRPHVRYLLKGYPSEKGEENKEKAEGNDGKQPVGRMFPEVSENALVASKQQVVKSLPAPRAIPVAESEEDEPTAVPAALPKPGVEADPQWQKAMNLLDQLVPEKEKESTEP